MPRSSTSLRVRACSASIPCTNADLHHRSDPTTIYNQWRFSHHRRRRWRWCQCCAPRRPPTSCTSCVDKFVLGHSLMCRNASGALVCVSSFKQRRFIAKNGTVKLMLSWQARCFRAHTVHCAAVASGAHGCSYMKALKMPSDPAAVKMLAALPSACASLAE